VTPGLLLFAILCQIFEKTAKNTTVRESLPKQKSKKSNKQKNLQKSKNRESKKFPYISNKHGKLYIFWNPLAIRGKYTEIYNKNTEK